jgi:hypothetical protein
MTKYSISGILKPPETPHNLSRVITHPITLSCLTKAVIVTTLGWLLNSHPTLAMALGQLVLRLWPSFRGV